MGRFTLGMNRLDIGLVEAKDGGAIKGNAIHKLQEGALNVFERGVLIEVLAIDGGDHGNDRGKHQETAVALVGFHDENIRPCRPARSCPPD